MSSWPAIPARWRDEGSVQALQARGRRRGVLLLLVVIVALVGIGVFILEWLRPPIRCRFVPLFVQGYRERTLPPLAWRDQDRKSLLGGSFFPSIAEVPPSLDQASLVRVLTGLRSRETEALVVYLSAYARTDGAGRVQLLPVDCDMSDPVTWLPLEKALTLFRHSSARRRLLVLDLVAPPMELRQTVILDDIWACVQSDLDAVPDADRLVLCAAAPGQNAFASEVLGQSAFARYLLDGLRGRADAGGNGQVSVGELAAFVRARVDRWARRTHGARQTPILYGQGRDFPLVELPSGQQRPPAELPEERNYPNFLENAWHKMAAGSEAADLLLAAERDWRAGVEIDRIKEAVRTAQQVGPKLLPPTPKARSLALALAGKKPSPDLVDALQQLVFETGPRLRGQPAAKADEIRGQFVDAFLKQQPKDFSHVLMARA